MIGGGYGGRHGGLYSRSFSYCAKFLAQSHESPPVVLTSSTTNLQNGGIVDSGSLRVSSLWPRYRENRLDTENDVLLCPCPFAKSHPNSKKLAILRRSRSGFPSSCGEVSFSKRLFFNRSSFIGNFKGVNVTIYTAL